ncbi:protein SPT2 homolog [Pungitius pungitius]|uniref:protein SPT2 homolog n=1 Tax=Pungitius pungitius TaxID=134920 RepID=UPI002E104B36
MMDFDNILDIATQNRAPSNSQKRYSLQAAPPKKDPRSKGVNPSAVQALLKKQTCESKKKEIQMKKKKEELLAKRVELKSDRKARAMASRTKDNFRGYNGIPVVELPKKRRSKLEMQEERALNGEGFRNNSIDPEDDEDNYEYEQTDSESEQEPELRRPGKTTGFSGNSGGSSNSSVRPSSKKPSGPPKPAPPPMNFAQLLKLAEKKQFEPVEVKTKVVKKEERLRTADEIRELELERKVKRPIKDFKADKERDGKSQTTFSSMRKNTSEQKSLKPQKTSIEKQSLPSGSGKKLNPTRTSDKGQSSSRPSVGDRERERPRMPHTDRDRPKTNSSSSSGAVNGKGTSRATSSQVSAKQGGLKPSSSHKSSTPSDLNLKKESSSRAPGIPGSRAPGTPVSGQRSQPGSSKQIRPSQGSSLKPGPTVGGHKPGKGEPLRPGMNSSVKSSGNSGMRPSSGAPPRAANQPQSRPEGTPQARAGGVPQARPGGRGLQGPPRGGASRPPGSGRGRGGPAPGRPTGSVATGPGSSKCTVVSETISSKNFGGPRPGVPRPGVPPRPGMPQNPGMLQRPGMAPRPGMPQRPMMNRPPGTMLPPITSAYKRKYDDDDEDEFDSEMDDFIDDGDEPQDDISRHIKEIFGYDRKKYKDESDYALKFMESSWRDMQKEEARSLRMAVQEDLEEEKRELEDLNMLKAKRKKKN